MDSWMAFGRVLLTMKTNSQLEAWSFQLPHPLETGEVQIELITDDIYVMNPP